MISFFDIRHSKAAMLVLNGKKVLGKKMDIHYALPKDNPGEKESNQGTLVVFNLDSSMTDDDIRAVFGEYGEVKEIRSTPNKNTHKFVEFFDVRDAERALLALNRTKVRSKIIKIEVSRPSNRGRRKGPPNFGAMMDGSSFVAYPPNGAVPPPQVMQGSGAPPPNIIPPNHMPMYGRPVPPQFAGYPVHMGYALPPGQYQAPYGYVWPNGVMHVPHPPVYNTNTNRMPQQQFYAANHPTTTTTTTTNPNYSTSPNASYSASPPSNPNN